MATKRTPRLTPPLYLTTLESEAFKQGTAAERHAIQMYIMKRVRKTELGAADYLVLMELIDTIGDGGHIPEGGQ